MDLLEVHAALWCSMSPQQRSPSHGGVQPETLHSAPRECFSRTSLTSQEHSELYVAFRNDVACVEHETLQPKPLKSRIPVHGCTYHNFRGISADVTCGTAVS